MSIHVLAVARTTQTENGGARTELKLHYGYEQELVEELAEVYGNPSWLTLERSEIVERINAQRGYVAQGADVPETPPVVR